ncbi:MAG: hypothetical protein R2713_01640 [Ilumatobacteraceae bacterium]
MSFEVGVEPGSVVFGELVSAGVEQDDVEPIELDASVSDVGVDPAVVIASHRVPRRTQGLHAFAELGPFELATRVREIACHQDEVRLASHRVDRIDGIGEPIAASLVRPTEMNIGDLHNHHRHTRSLPSRTTTGVRATLPAVWGRLGRA